jgi:hypothetical protein
MARARKRTKRRSVAATIAAAAVPADTEGGSTAWVLFLALCLFLLLAWEFTCYGVLGAGRLLIHTPTGAGLVRPYTRGSVSQ